MMRSVWYWSIGGGLLPAVFMLIAELQGKIFTAPDLVLMLWPTSIFLMATEGQDITLSAILLFAVSVAINVVFYAALGAMLHLLFGRLPRWPWRGDQQHNSGVN